MRRLLVTLLLLAAAAPAQAGAGLQGRWTGELDIGNDMAVPVVVRITDLTPGERGGSLRYPGISCRGRLKVLSRTGNRAVFRYRESASSGCAANTRKVRVRLRADGRLGIRIAPYKVGGSPGTGVLSR